LNYCRNNKNLHSRQLFPEIHQSDVIAIDDSLTLGGHFLIVNFSSNSPQHTAIATKSWAEKIIPPYNRKKLFLKK